ncbi:MAG: helix-turn-helix transcriptional regulator [Panacagrimonas sp.]
MGNSINLRSAEAMETAFRAAPEVVQETASSNGVGIYGWSTQPMEGFELAASDDLIIALHLGGSRSVRAITDQGLSRGCSAPGLLTLLRPGRTAAFRTEGKISLVTLHVPKAAAGIVQAEDLDALAEPAISRFAFRDDFAAAGMEALLRAARSGETLRPDYVPKLADVLLCHLNQWSVKSEPGLLGPAEAGQRLGCTSLGELIGYIDRGLDGKLSIDELARFTGLSRAAFTSAFKAAVGLSPHQYLSTRRVTLAKKMLRETDLDVGYIAQELGFSSQSHFTCVFRSLAGCTPARFRLTH